MCFPLSMKDTVARLLVTLRILRKQYKTKLPVEIFSFPGEIRDPSVLKQLEELDATVKEASLHLSPTDVQEYNVD